MNTETRYQELYKTVLEEHRKVFEEQDVGQIEALMDEIIAAKRIFVMA